MGISPCSYMMIHFRHFTRIYYICIRTIKPFMRTYFISHLWVKLGLFLGMMLMIIKLKCVKCYMLCILLIDFENLIKSSIWYIWECYELIFALVSFEWNTFMLHSIDIYLHLFSLWKSVHVCLNLLNGNPIVLWGTILPIIFS